MTEFVVVIFFFFVFFHVLLPCLSSIFKFTSAFAWLIYNYNQLVLMNFNEIESKAKNKNNFKLNSINICSQQYNKLAVGV